MSWTKRQLIEDAYGELALAGYEFDLSPEEMDWALRRLDTMMTTWSANGVQVGYAMGTPDSSSLDDDSGVFLEATEAVFLGLAVRLAAGKGKSLAASTTRTAKAAYDALLARQVSASIEQQQLAYGTPSGSGNKPWVGGDVFTSPPNTDPLQVASDGDLNFLGKGT